MTVLTALVILGGIQSIAAVCERLVPFMAIFYVGGCLIILALNAAEIPATVCLIVELGVHRAGGGRRFPRRRRPRGDALRGRARALLERVGARQRADRGRGGARPRIPSARRWCRRPARSGTRSSSAHDRARGRAVGRVDAGSRRAPRSRTAAFDDLPVVGPIVLTIGLLTFVFSTILGWAYYGEKAVEYLFGTGSIVTPYRWLWVVAGDGGLGRAAAGRLGGADITNALMAIPNLISLLVLTSVIVDETRTAPLEPGRSRGIR